MKNFIRHNIQNVKGSKKGVSIEREQQKNTTVKRYSQHKSPMITFRVEELEKKLSEVENNYQQEIIEQLNYIKEDIKLIKSFMVEQRHHSHEKQITQSSGPDE